MIYPEGDALKERVRNRYSLVVLASKRAKQIKEGAPPLIDTSSTNSLTIALEEIAAGKVSYVEHREIVEDDESPSTFGTVSEFKASSELGGDELTSVIEALSTEALSTAEEMQETASQAEEPDATASEPDENNVDLPSDHPDGIEEA